MRAVLFLILATGVVLMTNPATAFQTEVESREMFFKRRGLIRWNRQVIREAEEAAERARQEALNQPDPVEESASVPSTPAVSFGCLSSEQVASYARGAGFPESAVPTMVHIVMDHESGGCPGAVNGGGSAYAGGPACGLTQLYPCPGPEALNPATNMAYAFQKYQAAGGFSPWRH